MNQKIEKDLDRKVDDGEKIVLEFEGNDTSKVFDLEYVKNYLSNSDSLNCDYDIVYVFDEKFIVDTDMCKELEKIDNYLRERGKELLVRSKEDIASAYGFRLTLNANRKLDEVANKIKNATTCIDGRERSLSTYEKFMLVYEYVTDYVYNEGDDYSHETTSHWIPVIEGDKIVCVGYASLLKALCNRVFDDKDLVAFNQTVTIYNDNEEVVGSHESNYVYLKDDKYGIDGFYYVDACWDAVSEHSNDKPFSYCCIPLKDVLNERSCILKIKDGMVMYYLKKQLGDFEELDKEIEILFSNNVFIKSNNKDFLKYCLNNFNVKLNEYDVFKELEKLFSFNESIDKKTKSIVNKYKKVLKRYENVRVPKLFMNELIKNLGIEKEIKLLNEGYIDEKVIVKIGDAFLNNSEMLDGILNINNEYEMGEFNFSEFIINIATMSDMDNNKMKNSYVKRKEIDEGNKSIFYDEILKKGDVRSIPLEAISNSFRIVGEKKGLVGKELDEYVDRRLLSSVEKFKLNFNYNKCVHCFGNVCSFRR